MAPVTSGIFEESTTVMWSRWWHVLVEDPNIVEVLVGVGTKAAIVAIIERKSN